MNFKSAVCALAGHILAAFLAILVGAARGIAGFLDEQ